MRGTLAGVCKARSVVLGVQRGEDRLRVALDATPLIGPRTGVGRFCHGALGALGQRPELDVGAFAVTWRRRSWLAPLVPDGVRVRQRAMPARPLHTLWARRPAPPIEWFLGALDVVHGTNFVVPPSRRAARVVTVHDLTALRFPDLCDRASLEFPRMVEAAIGAGAWVHTPSEFIAGEVVAELGADPARVRVVYHGLPALTEESGEQAESAGDHRKADPPSPLPSGTFRYVLAVGTVEPRKDYAGLVHAFERVADVHSDVSLVIAGGDGWGASAFHDAVEGSRYRTRIVQLGYVSDSALARWLAGADVLAFPSVYEGFGFPPLEAMAAGVPVVATAAGAVPEVVGDAAVVVAPSDVEELAAALDAVLTDRGGVVRELVAKGRCRVAGYTWEACAGGLSALYADAAAAS